MTGSAAARALPGGGVSFSGASGGTWGSGFEGAMGWGADSAATVGGGAAGEAAFFFARLRGLGSGVVELSAVALDDGASEGGTAFLGLGMG